MHRQLRHQSVKRHRAGMVCHDQRTAGAGDVLDAAHLHAEPRLVQRPQQRKVDVLGEVLVEAVLIDGEVTGETPTDKGQCRGDATFNVIAGESCYLGRAPHGSDRHPEQLVQTRARRGVRQRGGDRASRHSGDSRCRGPTSRRGRHGDSCESRPLGTPGLLLGVGAGAARRLGRREWTRPGHRSRAVGADRTAAVDRAERRA